MPYFPEDPYGFTLEDRLEGARISVDYLVNNAGIADDAMIEDMNESQWDRVIDVNLKGAFLFTKAAARPMMRQPPGDSSG